MDPHGRPKGNEDKGGDGAPEIGRGFHLAMLVIVEDEPDRDPQQQDAADPQRPGQVGPGVVRRQPRRSR